MAQGPLRMARSFLAASARYRRLGSGTSPVVTSAPQGSSVRIPPARPADPAAMARNRDPSPAGPAGTMCRCAGYCRHRFPLSRLKKPYDRLLLRLTCSLVQVWLRSLPSYLLRGCLPAARLPCLRHSCPACDADACPRGAGAPCPRSDRHTGTGRRRRTPIRRCGRPAMRASC
jgi:hypothetical protein